MDLSQYDEIKSTRVLVYGPPKSGKTAEVGSLANEDWDPKGHAGEKFLLHWFDLEHGIKTLLNPDFVKQENRKNIKLINIPDHRHAPVAITAFRELFKGGEKKFCYAHGAHNCAICRTRTDAKWSDPINLQTFTQRDILVVDSLTQLSNSASNRVTFKEFQKDEEYKPTFHDWATQGMLLDEVLSKMQASTINICVISHDVDVEKDEKKEKIVPVGGTRNFSKTVAKYFDEVIYCQVLNKAHKIYSSTGYSNTVLTGGRSGVKLEDSKELSLADIFRGAK